MNPLFFLILPFLTIFFYKIIFSKNKNTSNIARFILLAVYFVILFLLFMPWSKIDGQSVSAIDLVNHFSMAIFVIFVLITILLLIFGSNQAIFLAAILNFISTIYVWYPAITLLGNNINSSSIGALSTIFIILASNIIGLIIIVKTKLEKDTFLGNAVYSLLGQKKFLSSLDETAIALGGKHTGERALMGTAAIEGQINGYKFKIHDFGVVLPTGINLAPVFRISISGKLRNPEFLIAFPKVKSDFSFWTPPYTFDFPKPKSKFEAYSKWLAKGDIKNPVNYLNKVDNIDLGVVKQEGWLVKFKNHMGDASIENVVNLVKNNFELIKNGWIVSKEGEIYFETAFGGYKNYSKEQFVTIVKFLSSLADLYKNSSQDF